VKTIEDDVFVEWYVKHASLTSTRHVACQSRSE